MPKTILALVPHPDDAEFYAGGTLAQMITEGATVHIVIATDGRCGSFRHDSDLLVFLRAEETYRAAAVLGAQPPVLLGYPDMGLDRLPAGVLREKFIRAIRQIRPDIVFAEDPHAAFETHPDHRAVAWAAAEAISYARLPLVHPEHLAEGLLPHLVVEKYFYTDTPSPASKIVDITDTIGRKIAALTAHRSQVEFLVEGVLMECRLAGLDLVGIFGPAADDPAALLAWGVQATAAAIGQQAGVQYAEAFRYERFGPLVEGMIKKE
jgi:LmbE family N-acetylglucosaminyl deacetylase